VGLQLHPLSLSVEDEPKDRSGSEVWEEQPMEEGFYSFLWCAGLQGSGGCHQISEKTLL